METLMVIIILSIILIGWARDEFGVGGGGTAPVIVSQSAPLVGASFCRTVEVSVGNPEQLGYAIGKARNGWNSLKYCTSEPHVSPDGLSAFFSVYVYDRD